MDHGRDRPAIPPPLTPVESAARINLRWLVRLRWGAVAGQVITILIARQFVRRPLPLFPLLAVCAALALVNVAVQVWLDRGGRPTDRAGALNLLGDIAALTALLGLSGGRENPFAVLYLVHITIGAVILPARWAATLALASEVAFSALQILPSGDLTLAGDAALLHLRARWIAFCVAAAFICTFSLRMSQSLRRRGEELDRARSDAEASERLAALGTLAAGTAHELNTPLATIQILAGELSAQLEGDRRKEAEEIRRQVQRCKEIISAMLAPRGGADVEEAKEFEVAPVLEAAVRRWREGRPGPLPELSVEPGTARSRARLPVRAFEQAIANLLDNAAEATAGQSARQVRISLQRVHDELRLIVADNGVGVPEHLLRRIGEPFFTTKEPGQGTGLGLYLARHVMEREGGEMRIDSAEGQGTRVTLTMPEV